jgi:uncharacterized protein YcaQ
MPLTLTPAHVRIALLHAQNMLTQSPPADKAAVLASIRQMALLQIDSINIVNRSHLLVLFSRLGAFDPDVLMQLLADGDIFEVWAHCACFAPSEHLPLFRELMHRDRERYADGDDDGHRAMPGLLEHIRANGAVTSSDFERNDPNHIPGWWNWKTEKVALERLFFAGELMVAKRHNFQRIYDLTERVQPDWDDANRLDYDALRRAQVAISLKTLGVAQEPWLWDYYRMKKAEARTHLRDLLKTGEAVQLTVTGEDATPYYAHRDTLPVLQQIADGVFTPERTTVLSPFDPLVWHRERLAHMFNFDYKIEVYTPAAKRKYGYYTMPILYKDAMIGRIDPKAHRKDGILEVRALHLEPDVVPDADMLDAVAAALREFADWHGTPTVTLGSAPSGVKAALKKKLK